MGSRKTFDKEFKLSVVRDLLAGKSTTQASREYGIKYDLARRWLREYEKNPESAFAGKGVASTSEAKCAELEREVGKLHMQIEFLKKCSESLQARLAETKTSG